MEKLLRSHRIAGAGILICTVALYLPTIGFDFLQLDDITYILSNPMVASGFTWEGFQWAFSSLELNQWMPVSMLSLMLDAELDESSGELTYEGPTESEGRPVYRWVHKYSFDQPNQRKD